MWKLRSLRSNESKYRPEIFPNALIAPPNGENVLYDSSELSKKLPKGCYSLSYSVKERYPGTATRDFFGKTLEANGWRKLEGSLLLPKSTRAIDWTLKITEDGRRFVFMYEHWISRGEAVIVVMSRYKLLDEQGKKADVLYLDQMLWPASSWVEKALKKYKEVRPEEFQ